MRHGWNKQEALNFIKILEENISLVGFHCGLTGSLLLNNTSDHDLDIIIFPHNNTDFNLSLVKQKFNKLNLKLIASRAQVARIWEKHASTDMKNVEAYLTADNRRVDFFYLT